jgi:hypothetical protein
MAIGSLERKMEKDVSAMCMMETYPIAESLRKECDMVLGQSFSQKMARPSMWANGKMESITVKGKNIGLREVSNTKDSSNVIRAQAKVFISTNMEKLFTKGYIGKISAMKAKWKTVDLMEKDLANTTQVTSDMKANTQMESLREGENNTINQAI